MRLVSAVVLTAFAGLTAHADTGALRQTQLEFLDAGASGGATARRAPVAASDKEALFKSLDINGDGSVSKAEAAGNAPVTLGFDRADRNKDGKLSRVEYDAIGRPPAKTAKTTKTTKTQQARNQGGAASAGGTKAKEKK